jgi:N-acetylmuramoyl-L-alanine amidase
MDFTPYFPQMAQFTKSPTLLVIHHTADPGDHDVAYYNQVHIAEGFVCFGAHALCRQIIDPNTNMAMLEAGRPVNFIGAQAYGINSISLGVETCGDFVTQTPSVAQVKALVRLMGYWALKFPTVTSIIGHEDVSKIIAEVNGLSTATACPGNNLYERIPEICSYVNKAIGKQLKNPYEHMQQIIDSIPDSVFLDESKLTEQGLYHD